VSILRIVVVVLALIQGSWMAFDGTRALTVGDYVTPSTGPHAGQLGPWHYAVEAVGIPARSTGMKLVFVLFGLTWLVVAVGFARHFPWARTAMLVMGVASLWYLPVGTFSSALVIICVLIAR
jgi:hypothetical protein